MIILRYDDIYKYRHAVAKWSILKYHKDRIRFVHNITNCSNCMIVEDMLDPNLSQYCISVLSKPKNDMIKNTYRVIIYYETKWRKENEYEKYIFNEELRGEFRKNIEMSFMDIIRFIKENVSDIKDDIDMYRAFKDIFFMIE